MGQCARIHPERRRLSSAARTQLVVEVLGHLLDDAEHVVNRGVDVVAFEHGIRQNAHNGFRLIVRHDPSHGNAFCRSSHWWWRVGDDLQQESRLRSRQSHPLVALSHNGQYRWSQNCRPGPVFGNVP
jgi:hypothetical protein